MDAGPKTIPDIFNGRRYLEIPFYQRAYVWDTEQWERFLEDMVSVSVKRKSHFFGPVILKQRTTSTDNTPGDVRLVIDGQQRLTTVALFFKALSLLNDEQKVTFQGQFLIKRKTLSLRHNYVDAPAFEAVMGSEKRIESYPNAQVANAFRYFLDNIPKFSEIDPDAVLDYITFVCIDLGDNEDEQQIFDSINSLGVRLTTAELLKNYLFDRNNQEVYRRKWFAPFEENEADRDYWGYEVTAGRIKRENIELMLYALLQIKLNTKSDESAKGKKVEVRLDNLFNAYKEIIGRDLDTKTAFINEIHLYAETYREHIDLTVTGRKLPSSTGAERVVAIIFGLDSTTLLPLTLYILRNVTDDAERSAMFGLLESYIMRRIVTRKSSMGYNRLFTEQFVSHEPTDCASLAAQIDSLSETNFAMPTDKELRDGFLNSKLNNKQARGVLYFLETRLRSEDHYNTEVLGLDQYTLEHVMPKKWINNWGKLPMEEDIQERNRALRTLGNLTLLRSALNTSVRDFAWSKKKTGGPKRDGLNTYAKGMATFGDEWLGRSTWDEETIRERGEWLYEKAVKLWES